MSQKLIDVAKGISQVSGISYDGALDDEGNRIELGLKRDEGHPVLDSRQMDGFKIRMHGPLLLVTYQADVKLKDVHDKSFENDIEQTLGDIVKHVKKEYKKITGNALTLSPIKDEEANILVQSTSNVRVFVVATKKYKIGNLDGVEEIAQPSDENRLDDSFKKFLDQGGFDGKKASNVTRKDVKDPKERILDQIPATTGYAS